VATLVKELRKRWLEEMQSNPDDKKHGTAYGYTCGCRCDKCSEAGTGTYSKRRTKVLQLQEEKRQAMLQRRVDKLEELFTAAEAPLPRINGKVVVCPKAKIERNKDV